MIEPYSRNKSFSSIANKINKLNPNINLDFTILINSIIIFKFATIFFNFLTYFGKFIFMVDMIFVIMIILIEQPRNFESLHEWDLIYFLLTNGIVYQAISLRHQARNEEHQEVRKVKMEIFHIKFLLLWE